VLARLPRLLLGCEGIAVAGAAAAVYVDAGYPWWLFVVLVLAPDLAMVGYLAGLRAGAVSYDALHTYVGPVLLGLVGVLGDFEAARQVALIWLTHIGVDRTLGYGLKYPSAGEDTHLQRL
jgi:hypothetical protein